ncbi:MAG TPA: DUF748 domain-containing protein [Saprospiraceae bacterium]|nr:DUF748 domain-containing protein [Saprospiraceae bacterium]
MMKSSRRKKRGKPTSKEKKQLLLRIGILLIVLIIAFRIILPFWVLDFVNKRLADINGYFGHVQDIDIELYRGAYKVREIYINKLDSTTQKQTPFFASPVVDISIEWKSLFRGEIVSEMDFYSPALRFTEGKAEPEEMEKDTNDFRRILKTFTPFKVNRFEVYDGKIQYLDNTVKPVVDIHLDNAHILARNLSNVVDTSLLPAVVEANADVYEGSLNFNMRIDALADDPTYDMNAEIKGANLLRLNDFFKAYADFDVNKGTFGMYMEIAAKDRKFLGYIKPVISDLDVVGPEDRKDSILRKLWESLVGFAGDVLTNPETEDIATKIPIAGSYDDKEVGIWYAILAALRNGFIQAIYPALDYQVTIGKVEAVNPKDEDREGFFKKIFGKPAPKKNDKKK